MCSAKAVEAQRPRSELRVIRPNASIKGLSRGGNCGRRFGSPTRRVLPEHRPGRRAYGICDHGRTDPLAIDPMTRGFNLWGRFATIRLAFLLGKPSRFLKHQSWVARWTAVQIVDESFLRRNPRWGHLHATISGGDQ